MKIIKNTFTALALIMTLSVAMPAMSYAEDLTGVTDQQFYDTHTFQTADTKPAITTTAVSSQQANAAYQQLVAANPNVEAQLSALMNASGGNAALVALASDPSSAGNILSMFDPRDVERVVIGLGHTSIDALETEVTSFTSPEELHYYRAQLGGLTENQYWAMYHENEINPNHVSESFDKYYESATSEECKQYYSECWNSAEEEYYWDWDEEGGSTGTDNDGKNVANVNEDTMDNYDDTALGGGGSGGGGSGGGSTSSGSKWKIM